MARIVDGVECVADTYAEDPEHEVGSRGEGGVGGSAGYQPKREETLAEFDRVLKAAVAEHSVEMINSIQMGIDAQESENLAIKAMGNSQIMFTNATSALQLANEATKQAEELATLADEAEKKATKARRDANAARERENEAKGNAERMLADAREAKKMAEEADAKSKKRRADADIQLKCEQSKRFDCIRIAQNKRKFENHKDA